MSLIQRKASPAQSLASRANSLRSTGPRSEPGIEIASRNSLKPRPFSQVVARSMKALGESPEDFEQTYKLLSAAMQPRDAWEAAWVQDIAILRWRLERLQRAEVGVLAVRKQKLAGDRKRESMPASGGADLRLRQQIPIVGLTGLPDSPWKFQQVIETLVKLRNALRVEDFAEDGVVYFDFLYGKNPGALGAIRRGQFQALSKIYARKKKPASHDAQIALLESVNQEISDYEQRQALYESEHLQDDPVRRDADLLLPSQETEEVIRYERHLEDLIERKLRQFYARRRESVLRPAEALPENVQEHQTDQPLSQQEYEADQPTSEPAPVAT